MDPSLKYLRKILQIPRSATGVDEAAINYAKLGDNINVLEVVLHDIVVSLQSVLILIRESFTVQKLHKYSSENNPNVVDIVASFIEFLVDVLVSLLSGQSSWIIIPGEINFLRQRLNFLLVIIRDIPFQHAESGVKDNILAQIESAANEAGIFIYSFFFTTSHGSSTEMDLELHLLLSKLEAVEETIKKHFAMILEQPEVTTSNLTSTYTYIVDSLLDDLNHLLNHETGLILEVKDQVTTLHQGLYSCRSMLKDIELLLNNDLIKCEVQLIDLTYQVEYVIACFAAGEVSVWYLTFRLHSFIQKTNPILASLTKFKLDSGLRGVCGATTASEVSSSQLSAKSIHANDEIIIGFKETRRQIASDLIGGPNRLQIIAIIGMGGLGKTTIARKLYNDSNVLLHFGRRSWCVVSQTYQKRKLLIDILSSLSDLNKDTISSMEDHLLAERLHKSLKRTRYLLVVDDLWKKEVWDDLKRYFPDDRNGSRILFTSRNKDVVLQGLHEPIIHDLPLLSSHECWDLLQKKVFLDSVCPQKLQDVGKEIATNCKGLPLAVVGIAVILANKDKKESLWQEVATNLSFYISKDQDILELSYWHLPSHLKPCFLFLGVFEEDKEIAVKELLYLWVSEGLIPKNTHNISEDIAEKYLVELINRNMVQVSKRKLDNGVKTFIMHDLIRDMCLKLGDKEKIVKVIKEEPSTCDQHHHICINSCSGDFTSTPFGLHVRSLFLDFVDLTPITSSMKRIRVLKLLERDGVYQSSTLEFLVQLRHLECVGRLRDFESHMNLEFLRIENPSDKAIQLNMPKLRHLHLGSLGFPLNCLHISQTNSLQTLFGISIMNYEDEERIRSFFNLRRLKCYYGNNWKLGSPNLSSLTMLVSLDIRGSGKFKTKFKTINFPTHIKKLSMSRMSLSCRLLSSIGTLPHLEILKLFDVLFEERRWNTKDDEFKRLKFLKLNWVILEGWNITSEDHFPVLEILVLTECSDLKLFPSDLGYIPTLQRIEVFNCTENARNWARNIQEEQQEAGNEQLKVIISIAFEEEDEDEDEDE